MKMRLLSVLLSLTLVLGLFPALTPHAHGVEHTCTDNNGDHRCDLCGYCMGEHSFTDFYNEGDENGHYLECIYCPYYDPNAQSPHIYDGDDDYICDTCGYSRCPAHDYSWDEEGRDIGSHRLECSVCGDTEWESHSDDKDSNGLCDVCSSCMDHDETKIYVWDRKTWDNVDHWLVCEDCGTSYGWEAHCDGDGDVRCDVCEFNLGCPHDHIETGYDQSSHWDACTDCGQIIFGKKAHSFEEQCYHVEFELHYPECDVCEYYLADEGEAHMDEDLDEECDACSYQIHEHTYLYDYWYSEDGYHYPQCDQCSYYDETKVGACADLSGDHFCDVCYVYMEALCYDTDGDHFCDGCYFLLDKLCADTDNDHICDAEACQRHMKELCDSEGDNWICDICGKNFCNHYFDNIPLSNHDGTHTNLCLYCGEVTENCYAWHCNYDETTHTAFCICGYEFPTEEHNYTWDSRSITGHLLYCKVCYYEKWEGHTTQNGTCEVCEMQVTAYDDVYVGSVGLKDGQYLDNSGNITTTKPTGGYAYYKDGVLELSSYDHEGGVFLWKDAESGEPDWATLYTTTELTLLLKGENSLQFIRPNTEAEEPNYVYVDGIAAEKGLTIRGNGSLSIQATDDGIQVNLGGITIESGTLTVNAGDHGFDVEDSINVTGGTVNVTAGDEGFDANGSITISDGKIVIDTRDIGMDAGGFVSISGGTVDITARHDDGIEASEDVTISDGKVTIHAFECGLDAGGSITVSGGIISMQARNYHGIYAEGVVIISGGSMIIHAEYLGISGSNGVSISGGELVVDSRTTASISGGGSVNITGGYLELTAGVNTVVFSTEGITVEANAALPEGVEVEQDEGGNFLILMEPSTPLIIALPFSAELKEGNIHLTNSPWGLTVMIASYDQYGKMIDIQVVEDPGDVVTPTVTGETVTAFFLNCRGVPAFSSLPIP